MNKIILYLLSFSLGVLVSCTTLKKEPKLNLLDASYPGYVESYNPKYEFIVRLHFKSLAKGNVFFCTGFVISDDYLITAAHCVMNSKGLLPNEIHIYSHLNEETGVIAKAAGGNLRMDVALVRGDFSSFKRAKIVSSVVDLTSPFYISCGFPFGQSKLFCYPVKIHGNYFFLYSANGFLFPGMSGGPVIDPYTGSVIALNALVLSNSVALSPLIGIFDSLGVKHEE